MKRMLCVVLTVALICTALFGCAGKTDNQANAQDAQREAVKSQISAYWLQTHEMSLEWFDKEADIQFREDTRAAIYLGAFDGFYVVITLKPNKYMIETSYCVAGYSFGNSFANQVFVYDTVVCTEYDLRDAYEAGLVSKDTVEMIYQQWVQVGPAYLRD